MPLEQFIPQYSKFVQVLVKLGKKHHAEEEEGESKKNNKYLPYNCRKSQFRKHLTYPLHNHKLVNTLSIFAKYGYSRKSYRDKGSI
jgi:hypothetical protein